MTFCKSASKATDYRSALAYVKNSGLEFLKLGSASYGERYILAKAKNGARYKVFFDGPTEFEALAKKSKLSKAKKQDNGEKTPEELFAQAVEALVAQGVSRENAIAFLRGEGTPGVKQEEEEEEMEEEEVVKQVAKAIAVRYQCSPHAAELGARKAIATGTVTNILGQEGLGYLKCFSKQNKGIELVSKIAGETGQRRIDVLRTLRKSHVIDGTGFDAAVQKNIAAGMSRMQAMRKARLENPEAFKARFGR